MFPFFFPSKISLKIEISLISIFKEIFEGKKNGNISAEALYSTESVFIAWQGEGGRMKDFFWGDHMVFRRNEQSVKGVCGKLTSNQMPMREDHKNITEPCGTYNQRPVTPPPPPPPRKKVITGSSPLVLIYLIWIYQETLISLIFSQATEN